MSTAGSYPVSAFSESKTFLVYDPSSQTTQRVLGSDLVNYITPNLNYVRTNTTRTSAQVTDYNIGIFVQVAGSTAIGDGGSSMLLVVASGEGDYVMNNGNELLVLPRGSLSGSDLDGALVTDNGVQREIQDAVSLRKITADSFAALMLLNLSGVAIASTASFYDGEAKGAADYAPDGTTANGTTTFASTAYADNSGFYDANGDGFSLSIENDTVVSSQFGVLGDGTDQSTKLQYAIDYWKALIPAASSNAQDDYGVSLLISGGKIRHDTSLDFSNVRTKGARVIFLGSALDSRCTGKAAVDLTSSRFMQWDNLRIIGNDSSQPSTGLLQGRSSAGVASGGHTFNNLDIMGSFSKTALLNFGSEECCYTGQTRIWNASSTATSFCYVASRANVLSESSDFQTIGTSEYSTNGQYFDNVDIRKSNAGETVLIDGARNLNFKGYCAYTGTGWAGNRDAFLKIETDSSVRSYDIKWHVHCEAPSVTVESVVNYNETTNSTILYGLDIEDYSPQADSILRFSGTAQGVTGLRIKSLIDGSPATLFSDDGATNAAVYQAEIINLQSSASAGSINLTNLSKFSGVINTFSLSDVAVTSGDDDISSTVITPFGTTVIEPIANHTISSGVIAITSQMINLKGEGALSDTLDTVTGTLRNGMTITIINTDASDVMTIAHDAGADGFLNASGADIALGENEVATYKYIALISRFVQSEVA